MGKLTFLHVSFTEYLLIWESEQIIPTVYLPGDVSCMKKGVARGLEIESGSWHLEYGRGPNITAMPFGLMDTLVSSVDLKPLALTTSEYMSFLRRGLRNRRRSKLPD